MLGRVLLELQTELSLHLAFLSVTLVSQCPPAPPPPGRPRPRSPRYPARRAPRPGRRHRARRCAAGRRGAGQLGHHGAEVLEGNGEHGVEVFGRICVVGGVGHRMVVVVSYTEFDQPQQRIAMTAYRSRPGKPQPRKFPRDSSAPRSELDLPDRWRNLVLG